MLNAIQRNASRFLVAGLTIGLLLSSAAPAAGLNDTGQQTCDDGFGALVVCTVANTGDAATYPGQDGRYGRDAAATAGALTKTGGGAAGFDFTALNATGAPTTPTSGATPHPCVRDNTTGLTWEVKTDDGSLRDKDWTYTWYSTDGATNGGNAGNNSVTTTCGGTLASCNTQDYIAAVNTAPGLCNFTDWRLPSVRELQTLVHYGALNPAIDTTYIPNTASHQHWSALSYGPDPAFAWSIYFVDGSGIPYHKSTFGGFRARLVRGEQF
ncbi:MAG: DUF1566 domain-containing protein [Candidatus Contendobacter sp.]|nr:DUF1566 domain-containing protein [Candidatus Contendobacter sp.]MDG4558400.1 DUF1566 domain-containing protein [Candidatus Contendobacter sp.]